MNQKFPGRKISNVWSASGQILAIIALPLLVQCTSKKPPLESITIMIPEEVKNTGFSLPVEKTVIQSIKGQGLNKGDMEYFDAIVYFKLSLSDRKKITESHADMGRVKLEMAIQSGSAHALLLKAFLVKNGSFGYPQSHAMADVIWKEYLIRTQEKVMPSKLVPWKMIGNVNDLK